MKSDESLVLARVDQSWCGHRGGSVDEVDEPTQLMTFSPSLSSPLPSDLLHYNTHTNTLHSSTIACQKITATE